MVHFNLNFEMDGSYPTNITVAMNVEYMRYGWNILKGIWTTMGIGPVVDGNIPVIL